MGIFGVFLNLSSIFHVIQSVFLHFFFIFLSIFPVIQGGLFNFSSFCQFSMLFNRDFLIFQFFTVLQNIQWEFWHFIFISIFHVIQLRLFHFSSFLFILHNIQWEFLYSSVFVNFACYWGFRPMEGGGTDGWKDVRTELAPCVPVGGGRKTYDTFW